ncbi:hypothetical protein HMPREF9442_02936 [Paraprevotella xylaniphila YIT 11841]|uniref:Uncharacterized protein n=1 Tax=Paraprevotella xylaniphila YIT 11841 TaxID=762982 RepID=F3QXL5_9BACT|nr:hypothetical protein HMPREF9442_02936 [Paraprevotella xylaniphila YIT 11841]
MRKDIHFSIRRRDLLSFFPFLDVKTALKFLICVNRIHSEQFYSYTIQVG